MGFCKQFSERERLIVAVRACQVDRVRHILREGQGAGSTCVNIASRETGETPLFVASLLGHASIVAELLQNGANTETCAVNGGRRPLHVASQYGHADVVRLLLAAGADWTAVTKSPFSSIAIPPVKIPAGASVRELAGMSSKTRDIAMLLDQVEHRAFVAEYCRLERLCDDGRAHLAAGADACGACVGWLLTLKFVVGDITSQGILNIVIDFMFLVSDRGP
jgi:hypothetical protein